MSKSIYCVLKRAVVTVSAHDNPIAAMSFNSLGNRIATASEKVTQHVAVSQYIKLTSNGPITPVGWHFNHAALLVYN